MIGGPTDRIVILIGIVVGNVWFGRGSVAKCLGTAKGVSIAASRRISPPPTRADGHARKQCFVSGRDGDWRCCSFAGGFAAYGFW